MNVPSLADRALQLYKINSHRGAAAPKVSDSWVYKGRGEIFSTLAYVLTFLTDTFSIGSTDTGPNYELKRAVIGNNEKLQAQAQGLIMQGTLKAMSEAMSAGGNDYYDFHYKFNNAEKSLEYIVTKPISVFMRFGKFKESLLPHLQRYFLKSKVGETATRVGFGTDGSLVPDITFTSPGFKPVSSIGSLAVPPKINEETSSYDHYGTIPVPTMESDKKIWNMFSYNVAFDGARVSVNRYDPRMSAPMADDEENEEAKTFPIRDDEYVYFHFMVTVKVAIPNKEAMWLNYAEKTKEISVPDINMLLTSYLKEQTGKLDKGDKISRIMPLTKSLESLKEKIDSSVTKIAPRTFKNLTVLGTGSGSGQYIFIPPTGEVEDYVKVYNDTYDPTTGKVRPTGGFYELRNKFLLADWYHNVLVWSNSEGRINTLDLAGSMAPTRAMLFRELSKPSLASIVGDVPTFVSIVESFCNSFAIDETIKKNLGLDETMFANSTFKQFYSYIANEAENFEVSLIDLINVGHPEWETKTEEVSELMKKSIKYFILVCKECLSFCNRGSYGSSAFSRVITTYKNFVLFGDMCYNPKNFERAKEEYKKGIEVNHPNFYNFKERLANTVVIPNLPGLSKTGLQPHQAQIVLGSLVKNPQYTILSVDAGGGKTALFLSQFLMGVANGHYHRGLIICPGGLKKSWVNEIYKYGEGRVNPFVLNNKTLGTKLRRLGLKTTADYINYIKALPPNTILITDYDFLRSLGFNDEAQSSVQYSDKMFNFYPNAHFIIQLGCDYVGIDESHRIKNLTSKRSQATKSVISYCKNRTLGSGTVLYNTSNDIVGQAGSLNPGILSDIRATMESDELTQNQKTKFITDTMEPFVAYNTAKKRDWAFMMPRINYNYIDAAMTSAQRDFYVKLIEEELKRIADDPKVKKILDSGDDEKIDKLLKSKLSTSFAPVEIFMNAPDSNEYFVNSTNTQPNDLIPPKSHILNQVIHAHFNGGTVVSATGLKTEFQKSHSKIVVFCYNKAISKALYKYLSPQYKAHFLHYEATAEGEKNLIRFQQDENIWGLVADETSISEGHNLQMASHAIRIQALWTPGGEEQSMSRVYRPDHGNRYKRNEITITTILCNNSLDIPKTARVMAKKISTAKVDQSNRPDWKEFVSKNNLPDLPLISMNLKKLLNMSANLKDVEMDKPLPGEGDKFSLVDYFSTYRKIITWDYQQGRKLTQELKEAVTEILGREPADMAELREYSYTKVNGDTVIKGSKAVYVPFIRGMNTIPDKMGLKLSALAIIEQQSESDESSSSDDDSDDDDNEDLIDNTPYEIGDLVVTEYGFGFIATIPAGQKNVVGVRIPGFQSLRGGQRAEKIISMDKGEVFKPLNEELSDVISKRLKKLEDQGKGLVFIDKPFSEWTLEDVKAKNIKPPKGPKVTEVPLPTDKEADHPAAKPGLKDEKPPKTNIDDVDTGTSKPTRPAKPAPKPTPAPAKPVKPVKPARPAPEPEDTFDDIVMAKDLTQRQKNTVVDHMTKRNLLFHYKPSTGVAALVDATVINGMVALTTYPIEGHFDKLEGASGKVWSIIPTFAYITINTYQGAQNLVDKLEQEFVIPETTATRILSLAKALKTRGKPSMVKQSGPLTFANLKNFIKINHTDTSADDQLKVYPVVWNGLLVVCAIQRIQPKAFNRFTKLRVSGCKQAVVNNTPSAYLFFPNNRAAMNELKRINERLHVINYDEIMDELKSDPIYKNLLLR